MHTRNRALSIGRLSKSAGVNIETIRYYEKEGLMPDPPRTEGGHRLYSEAHVRRLFFIRRSRELGFTLDEIRRLLELVDEEKYTCAEVKALTLEHAEEVRRKIADLQKLEIALRAMAAECDGGDVPVCPVIDVLFDNSMSPLVFDT